MSFVRKSVGCFLYAVFYTFCLYQNRSGITIPFFVGGTLFFFGYYSAKSGVTAARDNQFWMAALMILGVNTCITDSWVLIELNRLLGAVIFAVLVLRMYHEKTSSQWRVTTWCRAILHLFFGSLGQIGSPFMEAGEYWKSRTGESRTAILQEKQRRVIAAVLIGVVISMPVLIFVGLLLISADALFYQMAENVVERLFTWEIPEWLQSGTVIKVGMMTVLVFVYTYAMLKYCSKREYIAKATEEKHYEWDSYIAVTCTVMIAALYCLFDFVQIFGLFLGWMELPEGYTYASYARQGFFQLLFVCLFNICYVPVCLTFFRHSKVLNLLLTVICGCTYIMIASSAYRMLLYIGSYDLTFLRLFVLWALAVLAILMGGVIYNIYHPGFGLFRYLLTMVTIGYLCFAAAMPDYWIARFNVSKLSQGESVDTWYLINILSTDAAPVIAALNQQEINRELCDVEAMQNQYFGEVKNETEDMHIRNWNVSRAIARSLAE